MNACTFLSRSNGIGLSLNPAGERRFWKKVNKTDSCWIWVGNRNIYGYGLMWVGNHRKMAHRLSFRMHNSDILEADQLVCHSCDNPPCVNPDHLHVGNKSSNALEAVERGLWVVGDHTGENNGRAKITWANAQEIRARYAEGGITHKNLGMEYGLSEYAIFAIIHGDTWKVG